MSDRLNETLTWAVDNDVNCEVVIRDTLISIRATRRNIYAQFPVADGTAASIGNAFFSAIDSLKAGTEFHATNGHLPDPTKLYAGNRSAASGSGPGDSGDSEERGPGRDVPTPDNEANPGA